MNNDYFEMLFRMVAALAAGGIIGLERSYRGRAAGFRTHSLVCVASSLLMLVTVYESQWFTQAASRVTVDPTRMAQGIMTGIGFYFAAGVGTVLTLGTLSMFRWIEGKIPAEFYAHFSVRFARDAAMPEATLREMVAHHGFSIYNLNYRLVGEGTQFEYRAVLRAVGSTGVRGLSDALRENRQVIEYRIAPASD